MFFMGGFQNRLFAAELATFFAVTFLFSWTSAQAQLHYVDRGYRIHSYDIYLDVDFDSERLYSDVTMVAERRNPDIETLVLDASELRVSEVTLNGRRVSWKRGKDTLIIPLPRRSKFPRFKIRILSETKPNSALQFWGPTEIDPNSPRFSLMEGSYGASHLFPCDDHPSRSAKVNLRIRVPQDMVAQATPALRNIQLDREEPGRVFRFQSMKLPVDQLAIVAGEFSLAREFLDGLDLTLYYPDSRYISHARVRGLFGQIRKEIGFLEKYFAQDYPFREFSGTVMPTMQQYGFRHGNHTMLSLENLNDPQGMVQTHELTHTWIGQMSFHLNSNNELALVEGLADFIPFVVLRRFRGKEVAKLYMHGLLPEYRKNLAMDNRPLIDFSNADHTRTFDGLTYNKGAWFYRMLEARVGKTVFRSAIQRLVREFKYQPVSTSNLLKVFEETSGQELLSFFEQWLLKPGHPVLRWSWAWDHRTGQTKIHVEQIQRGTGVPSVFVLPLRFRFRSNGKWKDEEFTLGKRSETFTLLGAGDKPKVILLDPDREILSEIRYEKHRDAGRAYDWTRPRILSLVDQDKDPIAQMEALTILTQTSKSLRQRSEALSILRRVIRSTDRFRDMVRAHALELIPKVAGQEAIPDLRAALRSPYFPHKQSAVKALQKTAPEPSVYSDLRDWFDAAPFLETSIAMAHHAPELAHHDLHARLWNTDLPAWTRARTLTGLASLGGKKDKEDIRKALKSQSEAFRILAVTGIEKKKLEGFTRELKTLLRLESDASPDLQELALDALKATRSYESISAISDLALYSSIYSTRQRARATLTSLLRSYENAPPKTKRKHPRFATRARKVLDKSLRAEAEDSRLSKPEMELIQNSRGTTLGSGGGGLGDWGNIRGVFGHMAQGIRNSWTHLRTQNFRFDPKEAHRPFYPPDRAEIILFELFASPDEEERAYAERSFRQLLRDISLELSNGHAVRSDRHFLEALEVILDDPSFRKDHETRGYILATTLDHFATSAKTQERGKVRDFKRDLIDWTVSHCFDVESETSEGKDVRKVVLAKLEPFAEKDFLDVDQMRLIETAVSRRDASWTHLLEVFENRPQETLKRSFEVSGEFRRMREGSRDHGESTETRSETRRKPQRRPRRKSRKGR